MLIEEIALMLQKGRAQNVKQLVQQALDEGYEPKDILNGGLIQGMTVIGGKFKNNEVFVPEVLVAARAMNAGLEILRPALITSGIKPLGKAIICTVKGDLHDIGKNLVKMMLEGQGIECLDLGVDVSPEQVVEAVKDYKPDLVCLSALLTTTMMAQKETIDALKEAGIRDKVKVLIGGAPVTESFAKEIEADGYAGDAASAAQVAKAFLTGE
ncbi:MAG TPA: corrinoid protein [Bacilli bacterium]|jgi:5-methyltetrahydrofolate--homocysteine methyltransferase|nr:cobalamin-binding protein [Acholeplasmataceae bacterium]OQB63573.1 MAG: Methionine synthase [Tenericutes bacterium ADurb.Bin140]HON63673.1 corrinoid protein [Bacilli bacterium]HOR96708.1 corrinoid protein [Bacilli bacterium]HPD11916.1 corrinoid protein [Bacilli bacterium]